MPAVASARKRLERGIKRIEKTGWCSGELRCYDYVEAEDRRHTIVEAAVCLLGSLVTDKEMKPHPDRSYINLTTDEAYRLPGVPEACDAILDGLRFVDPDAYTRYQSRNRDEVVEPPCSFLVDWNDNLESEKASTEKAKEYVVEALKKGLERLPIQKQKK